MKHPFDTPSKSRPRRFRLPRVWTILVAAALIATAFQSVLAQDVDAMRDGMPLVLSDDFDGDASRWSFTDDAAWRVDTDGGTSVLHLHGESQYEPAFRSPYNIALVENLWVADFVIEARMKSTTEQYGHRDMIVFFGWQDPQNFYYVHLAPQSDAHANSIFAVDDADRVSIADWRTQGNAWQDDTWHTVRVERNTNLGSIRVFFDNMETPVMTAVDKRFSFGRVGVGSFDDTGMIDVINVWGRTTPAYESDEEVLALYDDLRVADVSDGMDAVGLPNIGLLDPVIEPLWRDIDELDHIVRGIAMTVRYMPANEIVPNPIPADQFDSWVGQWYNRISPEPFVDQLREGSILVIDASGDGDTGSVGSNNSLFWTTRGMRGIVTNGSVRDTDEIIKQQIPVYMDLANRGRGIRPGRNEVESFQQPVVVGGVQIRPGDVVVADGDGVIVVPREHARSVAEKAHEILLVDKNARRNLYEQLGRPLDATVRD
ncbi:MAG TPA: RraA family protein [Rhodothermales bacterium]